MLGTQRRPYSQRPSRVACDLRQVLWDPPCAAGAGCWSFYTRYKNNATPWDAIARGRGESSLMQLKNKRYENTHKKTRPVRNVFLNCPRRAVVINGSIDRVASPRCRHARTPRRSPAWCAARAPCRSTRTRPARPPAPLSPPSCRGPLAAPNFPCSRDSAA